MRKKLFLILSLLACMGMATAAEQFTVGEINIAPGGQATLTVNFKFDKADKYAAYQFMLTLPSGISAVTKSDGSLLITPGSSHDASMVPLSNYSSGKWIVLCYSTAGATLKGTQSQLLSITLQADAQLTAGTILNGSISDIRLSTADNSSVAMSNANFTITVKHPEDMRIILDETSTTAPEAAQNANIRVIRTIKGGEWNTIVLPFSLTNKQLKEIFGSDVKLADFTGYNTVTEDGKVSNIDVHFRTISGSLQANHPYLIKTKDDITEFVVDGVNIDPEEKPTVEQGTNKEWKNFVGCYKANTKVPEDALFINGGKFWYSSGKTKIKAFRAYFDFYDVLPSTANSRIAMIFDDAEATGIATTDTETTDDDAYYNLHGQRVDKPSKGIFVKENKKVVKED